MHRLGHGHGGRVRQRAVKIDFWILLRFGLTGYMLYYHTGLYLSEVCVIYCFYYFASLVSMPRLTLMGKLLV